MKEEISLKELLQTLLRGKGTVVKITLIVFLISAVYSIIIVKPYYTVGSLMYIDFQPYEYSKDYMQLYDDFVVHTNLELETFRGTLKSYPLLEEVIEDLNLDTKKYSPKSISQSVDMNRLSDERLYGITMKESDPETGAAIINALSDKLVDSLKDWEVKLIFEVANKELLQQKKTAEKMVNEALKDLEAFMKQTPSVLELDALIPNYLNKLAALKSQEIDAEIRLRKNREEKEYLETLNLSSDVREALLYANINIASSEGEISMLKESISQLEEEIRELQLDLAGKSITYDNLHRLLEVRKNALQEISDKYNASYISELNNAGNLVVSVVSRAYVPSQPDGPNVRLNLLMGLAAGLMIGSVVVLFKEYWNKEPKGMDYSSTAR
ncbi:GumC family protein [Candidatus Contubernalis alkaliaceticus]|uniref:GumC family protein n=1 Tax=Candidatus Contubernalis alkaliaceticus TaxID=338645 RepID=UPI001F4C2EFE|nr:Wzz/FepE/Etk N-terminal domain-containing protein [Candidatus Contubernalis alkalaceticus]UNC93642.1 hypothetical protein HUE98_17075 [Candidatus Contubernalis alkalaceticus]